MRYAVISALILAGCAASDAPTGNAVLSGYSLSDQRAARQTVQIFETAPEGAEVIGRLTAERCHRQLLAEEPTPEIVLDDLRMGAYAQGADAIANVTQERAPGLAQNCWYLQQVSADLLRLE